VGSVLLRPIARPLFASWYVVEGVDAVRHPGRHAAAAREGVAALRERAGGRLAGLDSDSSLTDRQLATVVQVHGAATVAAAGFLALGKAPRTAGVALAVLTVPLVVANLPTGKVRDEEDAARRRRFWTSLSALGGALLAAGDLAGRPSMAYRVHAAREARSATRDS
jgi:uncharacterized membrane protein YphA (DoxX/SURF4 family)